MFGREFLKNGSLVNRIENDPTILEYITPPTTLASAQTNITNTANQTSAIKNTNTTAVKNTNTSKPAANVKPAATVKNTNSTTTKPSPEKQQNNNNNNTQNNSSDTIYSVGG